MIRINLLPVRAARKKENIRRQVSVFFLCIVFGLSLMVYVVVCLNSTISGLSGKVEAAGADLKKYQAIVKQVEKMKKELRKLEEKKGIIDKLEADRSGPIRFMDALTGIVVADKMWLTSLKETKGKMILEGVATDNKTVADFMTHLEKSPRFEGVDLISSKQIKIHEDKKFKKFTITCRLSSRAPEKGPRTS
ncbi:MAG: PilN domain-containing protein [Desulfobacterales bacterium]|nr:PilN domain-containing protein [Desulfobacterales bacterium]